MTLSKEDLDKFMAITVQNREREHRELWDKVTTHLATNGFCGVTFRILHDPNLPPDMFIVGTDIYRSIVEEKGGDPNVQERHEEGR